MALSNQVIKVIRMYSRVVPDETVGPRLRALWDMLDDARREQVGDIVEKFLIQLLKKSSNEEINQVSDLLTVQERNAIFNIIKNDIISVLSTENDDDIDFIGNVNL